VGEWVVSGWMEIAFCVCSKAIGNVVIFQVTEPNKTSHVLYPHDEKTDIRKGTYMTMGINNEFELEKQKLHKGC